MTRSPRSALLVSALLAAGLATAGARAADEDMSLGSPKAPITVIEYASPTCPHCAWFNATVFPAFKAKYVDTGKVRYVLREFPIHPSLDGVVFLLARCAGEGRYFKVIDDVMRAQPEYFGGGGDIDISTRFYNVMAREGRSLGMSDSQAWSCMSDAKAVDALNARVAREIPQYAVDHTPTFVIQGVKVDPAKGQQPDLAFLDAAIAAAQAKKH
jgi:protein-disulfide isomerase